MDLKIVLPGQNRLGFFHEFEFLGLEIHVIDDQAAGRSDEVVMVIFG